MLALTLRTAARPALVLPRVVAARAVHMESHAKANPETEGPLYKAGNPSTIHPPSAETGRASKDPSKTKPRDPKSKNHKVTGGKNFGDLQQMHQVGSDSLQP